MNKSPEYLLYTRRTCSLKILLCFHLQTADKKWILSVNIIAEYLKHMLTLEFSICSTINFRRQLETRISENALFNEQRPKVSSRDDIHKRNMPSFCLLTITLTKEAGQYPWTTKSREITPSFCITLRDG